MFYKIQISLTIAGRIASFCLKITLAMENKVDKLPLIVQRALPNANIQQYRAFVKR